MIKFAVCIKAVRTNLVYENEYRSESYVINPYDLYALKELTSLKKKYDIEITCICMGSLKAEEVLKRAFALGSDKGILISDSKFGGADTVATVSVLSKVLEKEEYDYIICGKKTVDGETGQVPYGLAEKLGYRCIDNALHIDDIADNNLMMKVKKDEKIYTAKSLGKSVVIMSEYALKDNEVSLMALKKARKKEVNIVKFHDLEIEENHCGIKGSKTYVVEAKNTIVPKKESEKVTGEIKNKAEFLLKLLSSRGNN